MSGTPPTIEHPIDRGRTPRSPGGSGSWRSIRPGRRTAIGAAAAIAIFGLGIIAVDQSLRSPDEIAAPPAQPGSAAPSAARLTIVSFRFGPSGLTVADAAPIEVTNRDQAKHTFTSGTRGSPDGRFDLELDGGATGTVPPLPAGTYRYYCSIHPGMNGMFEVQP